MQKRTITLVLLAVLVLGAGCNPALTPPPASPIVRIGTDIREKADSFENGSVCVDAAGTVWVQPHSMNKLLQYTAAGGFVKSTPSAAHIMFPGANGNYILTAGALPVYRLYSLDPALGPVYLEDVTFMAGMYFSSFSASAALNSAAVFHAQMVDSADSLALYRAVRGTTTCTKVEAAIGEKNWGVHGLSCDESSLYVLLWLESGRYVYRYNAVTLTYIDRYEITDIYNPCSLNCRSGRLYVNDNTRLGWLNLNPDGSIASSTVYVFPDQRMEIYRAAPHNGDFIFTGSLNGLEGLFSYDPDTNTWSTVHQPDAAGDVIFYSRSVEADGDLLYVACGGYLKIFRNEVYDHTVMLNDGTTRISPCKTALNAEKLMVMTGNSSRLGLVTAGGAFSYSVDSGHYLYGIDRLPNGLFIVRERNGMGDAILRYDPAANIFTELFSLAGAYKQSDGVAVLDADTIVLNWNNQLKKYSLDGTLKLAGPVYSDIGGSIEGLFWSAHYNFLLMITSYGDLYLVDPVTLAITRTIDLDGISGQRKDLAVNEDGLAYVITWDNGVYRVRIDE